MGKYLKDKYLDSVLESYFNENLDMKLSNKYGININEIFKLIKEFIDKPETFELNIDTYMDICDVANILDLLPTLRKKAKLIKKNIYNWEDIIKYLDINPEEFSFEELGLAKFKEAKNNKCLIELINQDSIFFISNKSFKEIEMTPYRNRKYSIVDSPFIKPSNLFSKLSKDEIKELKQKWDEFNK